MDHRFSRVKWGPMAKRKKTSPSYWAKPLIWNRRAHDEAVRRKVFCGSLCDVLDEHTSIKDGWREDLLHLILATPALDWLLLTKRPENFDYLWPRAWIPDNVWFGVSVENQKQADIRIPWLDSMPAMVRFLSCEPLLEPINLMLDYATWLAPKIDWVIVGGESGPNRRPFHEEWARNLRDQCRVSGVPFFMKQIDKAKEIPEDLMIREFP